MSPAKRRGRPAGRPNFTPGQKAEALRLYAEVGAGETHRRTGIARSTLSNWASQAGVRAPANEMAERFAMRAPAPVDVDEEMRKAEAAEQSEDYDPEEVSRMWVRIARLSADAYQTALAMGHDMAAQRLNTCLGTATDKLQLLNGGATSRRENVGDPGEADEKLAAIFDAIRARRGGQLIEAASRPAELAPYQGTTQRGEHPGVLGPGVVVDVVPDATGPRPEAGAPVGGDVGSGPYQGTTHQLPADRTDAG